MLKKSSQAYGWIKKGVCKKKCQEYDSRVLILNINLEWECKNEIEIWYLNWQFYKVHEELE
jgi:hypothetical protein